MVFKKMGYVASTYTSDMEYLWCERLSACIWISAEHKSVDSGMYCVDAQTSEQ